MQAGRSRDLLSRLCSALCVALQAGELGAAVGFMCFQGLMLHIKDIETLCTDYPSTKVLIDHFGFCKVRLRMWSACALAVYMYLGSVAQDARTRD